MDTPISSSIQPMNLDYLRLLLATIVCLGHAEPPLISGLPVQGLEAVFAFFCISGYLITHSYLQSASLGEYTKKRIARIYPPIVLTVLFVFALGLIMRTGQSYYISASALLLFQDWNSVHLQGLYSHGAFWSLVVELQFYCLLPMTINLLRNKFALIGFALLYFGGEYLREHVLSSAGEFVNIARQNILFYIHFFIAGVITAYYRFNIPKSKVKQALLTVLAILIYRSYFDFRQSLSVSVYFLPFAMMFLIMMIGKYSMLFGNKAFFGDLSYGMYMYHFPIMGFLTFLNCENAKNVFFLTLFISFLSWHLLEKRCLRLVKAVDRV